MPWTVGRTAIHSVSSTMIFLNGCLIAAWSRSQKSIALSSCEAEFLASAGGAAESVAVEGALAVLEQEASADQSHRGQFLLPDFY